MPTYVLVCTECGRQHPEQLLSIAVREKLLCTCGGKLTNDYSRQRTTSFRLKGQGWPGKQVAMENRLLKEGSDG